MPNLWSLLSPILDYNKKVILEEGNPIFKRFMTYLLFGVVWLGSVTLALAESVYRCPMHAEVIKSSPGTCPICNMKLVGSERESKSQSAFLPGTPASPKKVGEQPSDASYDTKSCSVQRDNLTRLVAGSDTGATGSDHH